MTIVVGDNIKLETSTESWPNLPANYDTFAIRRDHEIIRTSVVIHAAPASRSRNGKSRFQRNHFSMSNAPCSKDITRHLTSRIQV